MQRPSGGIEVFGAGSECDKLNYLEVHFKNGLIHTVISRNIKKIKDFDLINLIDKLRIGDSITQPQIDNILENLETKFFVRYTKE